MRASATLSVLSVIPLVIGCGACGEPQSQDMRQDVPQDMATSVAPDLTNAPSAVDASTAPVDLVVVTPDLHPAANECDATNDPKCPINGASDCSGTRPLLPLGVSNGRMKIARSTPVPGSCNSNGFYSLDVTTTSDLFLHTTLDPTATIVRGGLGYSIATSCEPDAWSNLNLDYTRFANCNFGTPTEPTNHWARRLAPGSYIVAFGGTFEVPWSADATGTLDFAMEATLTPSPPTDCTNAPLLTSGVPVMGETNATDTFFQTYPVYPSTDRVHQIELTARSRVRLEVLGVKVALVTACDADLSPILSAWKGEIAEGVLDAGTYFAVIESALPGQVPYTLTFTAEPADLACASAPLIGGTGAMLTGDTTGKSDDFRGPENAVAGDDVYRLDLATRTRVVTQLSASYPHGKLMLYRGCGEVFVAQTDFAGDPDVTLEAGVYHLVVDGALATSVGAYALDVEMIPAP